MLRRPVEFENGLTVADLKAIIMYWPEMDEDGNPCEVWISDGNGLSSQVRTLDSLNLSEERGDFPGSADILLSHGVKTDRFVEQCAGASRAARFENKMYYVGINRGVISTSSDRPKMDRLLFTAYPGGMKVLSMMGRRLAESLGVIDAFK